MAIEAIKIAYTMFKEETYHEHISASIAFCVYRYDSSIGIHETKDLIKTKDTIA